MNFILLGNTREEEVAGTHSPTPLGWKPHSLGKLVCRANINEPKVKQALHLETEHTGPALQCWGWNATPGACQATTVPLSLTSLESQDWQTQINT